MDFRSFGLLIGGAAVGGLAVYVISDITDKNYEECMVRELRGQERTMYTAVADLCARRFKRVIDVPASSAKITWTKTSGAAARISVRSDIYELSVIR